MKHVLILITALALTACSTTRVGQTELPKVATGTATAEVARQDKVQFPAWYVDIPSEENAMYAAATESSTDLQLALDKAAFSAKREIAFKVNNDINQKIRESATETNYAKSDTGNKQFERLTIATSKNVNLVGVTRVKSEVYREGNKFRAYVLVRYAYDNNLLQAQEAAKRRVTTDHRLDKFESELKGETVKPEPTAKSGESISLMKVDNEEYKRRRDEALVKPDAVIGQVTVR